MLNARICICGIFITLADTTVDELYGDMVQILLMTVISTQESEVEYLFCGASSGCETSLFFINNLFSMGL